MKIGVVFPQLEIGTDPALLRDYAQTAESVGLEHIAIFHHVLGADTATRPDWRGPYTDKSLFHEPLVLFGFLAGLTQRIEFCTSIIIAPQRQTALLAKQAAEVDVLSGGRLRLGLGSGWNEVEYEGLNENFHNRGRRLEEQITVLRKLWTEPVVNFKGKYHTITAAGLNPLPVQRPIPIWLGGMAEPVLRRVATIADGWFPQFRANGNTARATLDHVFELARAAGRDPQSIGIEGRLSYSDGGPDEWAALVAAWRDLGASHVSFNTMGGGLANPAAHIDAIRRFAEAAKVAG
jgi:probable F420-dependent oxidoreductase